MSHLSDTESYIARTLDQLTIEEKAALLSGSSFVAATGVPRLNIPAIYLVDSVNGVKGTSHINGTPTLCFPSTTCLGSTWNTSLMEEMGRELAVQANYKNASVILGPTVNIHRDPRGGRNFECFSEDPLLTGKLAASLINGIQSGGVAACPKHFICNESETKRRFYRVEADSRTMREIYLAAFQHLLAESNPMAIMTAYNKIDGVYCSESPIVKEVLRDEWDFDGVVMSDWFGTRSGLPALQAGLDLEMPGPSVFRGEQLVLAVKQGQIDTEIIDDRARRVLMLIHKTRRSDHTKPELSVVTEKANLFARRVASQGIVLLKNDKTTLPLRLVPSNIAVIGTAAKDPPMGGGGSAKVPSQYLQSPLDCIKSTFLDSKISYAHGCKTHSTVPGCPLSRISGKDGRHGIDVEYFVHDKTYPVLEEFISSAQMAMIGHLKPPLTQESFCHFSVSTMITPTTSGLHTIAIQATGAFELLVNEKPVLCDRMQPPPSVEDFLFVPAALERKVNFTMEAGRTYLVKAIVQPYVPAEETGEPRVYAAKLCFEEECSEAVLRRTAVLKASSSDISIIFAGRDDGMESEGFDLTTIKLPLNQEVLIQEVAKSSPRTVLILYGGNPIDVSAYEHLIDAILFVHFPGQEGSQAITDILAGITCPSGRLATSWPVRLEDVPTFGSFPAQQAPDGTWTVRYAEGLQVGYRADHYAPRYQFGFGLSYTQFHYSNLSCSEKGASKLVVKVEVANCGVMAGHEVVQVYVSEVRPHVYRPRQELKGFDKIWLEAGETKTVSIELSKRTSLSWWDDRVIGGECWTTESGDFRIRVGDLSVIFRLNEGFSWWGLPDIPQGCARS